jgi:type VI secretion system secreted protein Hcp
MRRSGFKGLVAAGLVATSIAASTSVVSASDMFLKMSGIKGESLDKAHKEEIEILSWSWGTSTGTGRIKRGTVAPQCIQDLVITKFVDSSTPQLITNAVVGQPAKEAILTVRKSGGDQQQDYLIIKMADVLVTSYQTGGSDGSNLPLVDTVMLSFSSIQGEYIPQRADGSPGNSVFFNITSTCPDK